MFSLRDWKDPDVHDANSAWVRLAVALGIGVLCSINPLQSSCTPLSQYMSQVSVEQSVCVGSCLRELQSFSLGEFQIAPKYCMLVKFPSVFAYRDSAWILIVLKFFLIWSSIHRVHGCEKRWLPVPSKAFSSWDQSTFDNGVHFESVPDVVDVLGKLLRYQYIVSQSRIHDSNSWVSLDCYNFQEMFGRIRVQSSTETFSSTLLPLPGSWSKLELTRTKYTQTITETILPGRQILLLHHLIEELLYHHVAAAWSCILTLQNNLDWIFLDQRLSNFLHDKE